MQCGKSSDPTEIDSTRSISMGTARSFNAIAFACFFHSAASCCALLGDSVCASASSGAVFFVGDAH